MLSLHLPHRPQGRVPLISHFQFSIFFDRQPGDGSVSKSLALQGLLRTIGGFLYILSKVYTIQSAVYRIRKTK
jgi:hypothetical protein